MRGTSMFCRLPKIKKRTLHFHRAARKIVMRRIEFFDLFAQKRFVGISGKSDNLESVGMRANRVKHLSANRAGASEYCNRFHFILRNLRAAKAEI